jgi:hypothetical protein
MCCRVYKITAAVVLSRPEKNIKGIYLRPDEKR